MLNIWQHQKQQPQIKVAIKNMSLTCRPSWCRLDSSYCWSKKKLGLGTISHTISTIFFFSADWNSLFRKVRWSDIMNLKIGRAVQCALLCLRYSASSAQQRAAKLSSAVHQSSVELRAQWTRSVYSKLTQCFSPRSKNIECDDKKNSLLFL